jgi:hypothetical protein
VTDGPGSLPRMVTRVLVDANVLFSRTQRDWLFLLKLKSEGRIFTVASTVDIVAETVSRYRDKNPTVPGGAIVRLNDLLFANLDERVDEYTVDDSFAGADQGDAHVDAAARAAGVDVVLTCDTGWANLGDEALATLPYEVQHPDYFFCLVDDASPATVRLVIRDQVEYWMSKHAEADLPASLRAASCPDFAERVRKHLQAMG